MAKSLLPNNPTYRSWAAMIQRCTNQRKDTFKHYGGRGIKVCDRWLNSFKLFLLDMGDRPDKSYSLDRINVDGNYEPSNCRWATKHEQGSNCRNSVFIEFNGKRMTYAQWGRETGIDKRVIWARINDRKWTIEKALTKKPSYCDGKLISFKGQQLNIGQWCNKLGMTRNQVSWRIKKGLPLDAALRGSK